jgi:hypothetical protein
VAACWLRSSGSARLLRHRVSRQDHDTEHSGPGMRANRRSDLGDKAFRHHGNAGSQLGDKVGSAFRCSEVMHR